MQSQVAWRVRLTIRTGGLEDFKALTKEMLTATRAEPGVLAYERFVSADGGTVHVHERYQDSKAAAAHLETFRRDFAARFSQLVKREEFLVYGRASPELKAALAQFRPLYFEPLGDLAYWSR